MRGHRSIPTILTAAALIWAPACGNKPGPPENKTVVQPVPVPHKVPPPRFSPAYGKALEGVLDLEPDGVAALETKLRAAPGDYAARLKLLAYHMRADRAGRPDSRAARANLTFWLIEHQPDSEILASPYARFEPGHLTPAQYERAAQLWAAASSVPSKAARVAANAAAFFAHLNPRLSLDYLETAHSLDPSDENTARELGGRYASALLSGERRAAEYAGKRLDATSSPAVLAAAARMLQSDYNRSRMLRQPSPATGQMAERYFRRAKALDPQLDEVWVYPKLDPKLEGLLRSGAPPPTPARASDMELRTLPPEAFRQLPAAIAEVLRERACRIPQPEQANAPANVIEGAFLEAGTRGWAVLCSVKDSSTILVFRDGQDTRPEELARASDDGYFQSGGDGRMYYSRMISPVDRRYIVRHYRAYGGPEPPEIDHQGIDDAFLEKASIVYYRHRGKWLQLTGAD